jgi:hypothetical protein
MADANTFALQLGQFAQKTVPEQFDRVVRRTALSILRGLVKASPVDTGRFRASWGIAVGAPYDQAATESRGVMRTKAGRTRRTKAGKVKKHPVPQPSFAARSAGLGSFRIGETVHISNPLPYGPALNNGHSRQAPAGFVDLVVDAVRHEVQTELGGME